MCCLVKAQWPFKPGSLGSHGPIVAILGTEQLQVALDVLIAPNSLVEPRVHVFQAAAGVATNQVRPAVWRAAQLPKRPQLLLKQITY